MDIQQAIAPTPAKAHSTETNPSAGKAAEAESGGTTAAAFAQLLHGMQDEGASPAAMGAEDMLQALTHARAGQEGLQDLATLDAQPVLFSVESLVGQTQRLDASDADAALQDGSFLIARQDAGWRGTTGYVSQGAQPPIATGQSVATVAAGVQPSSGGTLSAAMDTAPAALAAAVLADGIDVASGLEQAVTGNVESEQHQEGRVALLGAWRLEDPQAQNNPALQRLLGQVEQWAAASAGVQPKPMERSESSKNASQGTEWLSAGQASGTRLMENAVREAQSAQDAVLDTAAETPVEDMRFWLQGKQQRAEVVLEKDGQPVRVQVMVRGNEAHVTFRAEQADTRELLDASLAQLREMLEQQGVELAGVSVQTDAQGGAAQEEARRNPWEAAPMLQAQVAVPVAPSGEQAPRTARANGIDLYA